MLLPSFLSFPLKQNTRKCLCNPYSIPHIPSTIKRASSSIVSKAKPSKLHKISMDDRNVRIPWEEGKTSSFHHIWLRDHCRCPECFHQQTMQRLVDTSSIPSDIKPSQVEHSEEGLQIIWQQNGHTSIYPWDWLHRHSYRPRLEKKGITSLHLWGSEIKESPPTVEYIEVLTSDTGVAKWTAHIEKYGFCLVDGVPPTPEETQKLVERIAFVKPTHYGGFWDFTSNLDHKDTAYTTLALKAHTDTTYFTQPAGLQLFHLLEFDGQGGESLLVDGFQAAKILRETYPDAYKVLSRIRIPTHSAGDQNVFIQPSVRYGFPVLNHDPTSADLYQIRWNNNDRSTMDFWSEGDSVEEFYDAIKKWDAVLTMKENEFWQQLRPGRALSMPSIG